MDPWRRNLRGRPGPQRAAARGSRAAVRPHRPRLPRRVPRGVHDRGRARPSSIARRIRAPDRVRESPGQRGAGRLSFGGLRGSTHRGPPARVGAPRSKAPPDRTALAGAGQRTRRAARSRRRAEPDPVHVGQHGHPPRRGDHGRQLDGQRRGDGKGFAARRRRPRGLLAAAVSRHGADRRAARPGRARSDLLDPLAAGIHAASGELDAGGVGCARDADGRAELRLWAGGPQGRGRGSPRSRSLRLARRHQRRRAGRSRHRRGILPPARPDGLPGFELFPRLRARRMHAVGGVSAARPRLEDRSRPSRRPGERQGGPDRAWPRLDAGSVRRTGHRGARGQHRQRHAGPYSAWRAASGADLGARAECLAVVLREAPTASRTW